MDNSEASMRPSPRGVMWHTWRCRSFQKTRLHAFHLNPGCLRGTLDHPFLSVRVSPFLIIIQILSPAFLLREPRSKRHQLTWHSIETWLVYDDWRTISSPYNWVGFQISSPIYPKQPFGSLFSLLTWSATKQRAYRGDQRCQQRRWFFCWNKWRNGGF